MIAADTASRAARRAAVTAFLVRWWPAILVVLVLFVEHLRDHARDTELTSLRQRVAADSAARVAQGARTDTIRRRVDTAAHVVAHADTVYRRAASTVRARVDTILASSVPDTVKIRELVHEVDTLRVTGDSVVHACTELANTCQQLRVQVDVERAAWASERKDLTHALDVSEARHRHWGLGVTAGAAAMRLPDGSIRAGPGLTLGITYRW
jgi:hypothetical protein